MSSLCLIFVSLINMCLAVFRLGFILFGTLWFSWTRMIILPHFREVFNYYLLEYFLMVFLFVFFFWDSYDSNIGSFNIVLEVSEVVHISFNSFYFFPLFHLFLPEMATHSSILAWKIPWMEEPDWLLSMESQRVRHDWVISLSLFTICLLPHLSYLLPPLFYCWFPPECFWSHLLYYSLYIDSFRSLLNLSCIFSILLSRLFICNSNLFSRFWIIFTIIIQNSLSGSFPISSSFVWFGGHLSCSFTCWVFLCLFILFILLCFGWPFCILAVGGSSLLWRFLMWVGLDGWLGKVPWLGKLVSVFWWMELDYFSLECNEMTSNEFWDVSGFGVTLGSLYIEAQSYVPVLLENLCGMSCSGTCWPLGGAWFQCTYGGVWWAPID